MYELVLVLVPPGEPDPLCRSYELITPYLRDGELSADTYSETFGE